MLPFTFCLLIFTEIKTGSCETMWSWNNNTEEKEQSVYVFYIAGASASRQMAEVGALQRLPEWKPAQRIPVGGNELVTVQLVQQVNTLEPVKAI